VLFADRKELWPRLEKFGQKKVLEMLATNQFEAHEEEEVNEWLTRRFVIDTLKETNTTKRIAIVSAVAAIISAIASVVSFLK